VSIEGNDDQFFSGIAGSYMMSLKAPHFAFTETGYHTDSFTNGVTEVAQVRSFSTLPREVTYTLKPSLSVSFSQSLS